MRFLKKADKFLPEFGRTMIEMLGVLAIAGIITIIGITGYIYALENFRENETVDQFSKTVAGTRTGFIKERYMERMKDGGRPINVPIADVISDVDFNAGRACPEVYALADPDYCHKQDEDGRTPWGESFHTATGAEISVQIESAEEFAVLMKGLGVTEERRREGRRVCQKITRHDFGQHYIYAKRAGTLVTSCGAGDAGSANVGYTPERMDETISECLCDLMIDEDSDKMQLYVVFGLTEGSVCQVCETNADCEDCEVCGSNGCCEEDPTCTYCEAPNSVMGVLRSSVVGGDNGTQFGNLYGIQTHPKADCCMGANGDNEASGDIVYYDTDKGLVDCCPTYTQGWTFIEGESRNSKVKYPTTNGQVEARQGRCCAPEDETCANEGNCCAEAKESCNGTAKACIYSLSASGIERYFGCDSKYVNTDKTCCESGHIVYEINGNVGCCSEEEFVESGTSTRYYYGGEGIAKGCCGEGCNATCPPEEDPEAVMANPDEEPLAGEPACCSQWYKDADGRARCCDEASKASGTSMSFNPETNMCEELVGCSGQSPYQCSDGCCEMTCDTDTDLCCVRKGTCTAGECSSADESLICCKLLQGKEAVYRNGMCLTGTGCEAPNESEACCLYYSEGLGHYENNQCVLDEGVCSSKDASALCCLVLTNNTGIFTGGVCQSECTAGSVLCSDGTCAASAGDCDGGCRTAPCPDEYIEDGATGCCTPDPCVLDPDSDACLQSECEAPNPLMGILRSSVSGGGSGELFGNLYGTQSSPKPSCCVGASEDNAKRGDIIYYDTNTREVDCCPTRTQGWTFIGEGRSSTITYMTSTNGNTKVRQGRCCAPGDSVCLESAILPPCPDGYVEDQETGICTSDPCALDPESEECIESGCSEGETLCEGICCAKCENGSCVQSSGCAVKGYQGGNSTTPKCITITATCDGRTYSSTLFRTGDLSSAMAACSGAIECTASIEKHYDPVECCKLIQQQNESN